MRCECTGSYSFREVTVACKRYITSSYKCLSSGLVKTVSAGKVMSRKLSSSLRSFVSSFLRAHHCLLKCDYYQLPLTILWSFFFTNFIKCGFKSNERISKLSCWYIKPIAFYIQRVWAGMIISEYVFRSCNVHVNNQ